MSASKPKPPTHWILGSFKRADKCLAAIRALRVSGEKENLDIYSAYPLHGAEAALGLKRSKVPLIVLCCAIFGAFNGYTVQTWANATSVSSLSGEWLGSLRGYILDVGGRTAHAWPLNIPITFELGVLISAFGAVLGMLIINGLPRLHHPVFEVEAFRSAQIDRYWISVTTKDDLKREQLREQLAQLGAEDISTVEEGADE
ncbi:MAG: DUF3341 domain-containing protein [Polyangia bacterium]